MTHNTCKSGFHRFFRLEQLLRGKKSQLHYISGTFSGEVF